MDIQTLQGTFGYMSPELRTAFVEHVDRPLYHTFKSDVYSLGMTVLSMATLHIFRNTSKGSIIFTNPDSIDNAITQLRYSESLKTVLRGMLAQQIELRPDFLQLHETLRKQAAEATSLAQRPAESLEIQLKTLLADLLAEKLHLNPKIEPISPEIYLSQLELTEKFAKTDCQMLDKASNYLFPYIPLSHILSNLAEKPTISVIIRPSKGISTALPQITTSTGLLYGSDLPFPSFIVRKMLNSVTITEPATSSPVLSVRLKANQEKCLLEHQLFRLGTVDLWVSAVSPSLLTLRTGENFSQVYNFTPSQAPFAIGQGTDCLLRLPNPSLGKIHTEVKFTGKWVLRSLETLNGTWVCCHTMANCDRESNEERLEQGSQVRDSLQQYEFQLE